MMSSCNDFYPQRLDGWKDLYLFNCSSDIVTIETSLTSIEEKMHRFYQTGPYETEPIATFFLKERIHFYQWLFKLKVIKRQVIHC